MPTLRLVSFIISLAAIATQAAPTLQPAKLFAELPDDCPTPDAFALAPDGSITLSCPNYAGGKFPGALLRVTEEGHISKLAEVEGPVPGKSGRPMGIAYGPDGTLYVNANGRLLSMTFNEDQSIETEVIASGLQGPNGLRYHQSALYVTIPMLPKFKTEKNTGGVYRFAVTDRDVQVNSDPNDANLIFTAQTENPDKQFGLDGLEFGPDGHLFVGDFGDGIIYRLELDTEGVVLNDEVYADLETTGIDGMVFDPKGNLFVAGFSKNTILRVSPDRTIKVVAEYPDNDGSNGQLDQPVDLLIFKDKLLISNFDLMSEPTMVNTRHDRPYTLSYIELDDID